MLQPMTNTVLDRVRHILLLTKQNAQRLLRGLKEPDRSALETPAPEGTEIPEARAQEKKRLMASLPLLLFCGVAMVLCVAAFSKSFGWFAMNENVGAEDHGQEMEANRDVEVEEYRIFRRNGTAEGATDVTELSEISMTEYDTVFTDRNVNTPIILRVVLKNVPGNNPSIRVHVECGYDGEGDADENWQDGDGHLTDHLSNIAEIRYRYGDSTVNALTEPNEIYDAAVAMLKNADGKTFASVSGSAGTWTNESKVPEIDLSTDGYYNSGGRVVLFIELNYSDDLVAAYLSQNEIDVTVTSGVSDMVDFPNDLTRFEFFYE